MAWIVDNLLEVSLFVIFFFSSRRRHTIYWRDWSSDVCSSDLRWLRAPRGPRLSGRPPPAGRDGPPPNRGSLRIRRRRRGGRSDRCRPDATGPRRRTRPRRGGRQRLRYGRGPGGSPVRWLRPVRTRVRGRLWFLLFFLRACPPSSPYPFPLTWRHLSLWDQSGGSGKSRKGRMFWRYGTIFGLSFESGGMDRRGRPVGDADWETVFGRATRAEQARGRAAGLHLRGLARRAAGEHPAVRPGARGLGRPNRGARPRLPDARLLRARRRLSDLGDEEVGLERRRRVRDSARRNTRPERPRGCPGLGRLLPRRGPRAIRLGRLPLLALSPVALPLRGGRREAGGRAAADRAQRGAPLVVGAPLRPRSGAPRAPGRVRGGGARTPDAAPGGRLAACGRGGRRPPAQRRASPGRGIRLRRGALPRSPLLEGRREGGEPLAGPPHHGGEAQDRADRPGVDHRAAHGAGAAPFGRDRPLGGGGRPQGRLQGS